MASKLSWSDVRDIRVLVSTTCGLGLVRWAPGTVASLAAVLVWWFLLADLSALWQSAVLILFACVAYYCVTYTMRQLNVGDDGAITADEVLGQWIALLALPKTVWVFVVAFFAFRVLDIFKPFPIRWFERHVKGSGGVLADDVVAGVFVLFVLHIAVNLQSVILQM